MTEAITAYIGSMSPAFFAGQTAAIMLLFLMGAVLNMAFNKGRIDSFGLLICFPTGLSFYSLSAFLLLVTGIPFNVWTVTGMCLIAAVISMIVCFRSGSFMRADGKRILFILLAVLCIAALSSSGILPVSLSNDSMYYYTMYPRALVRYGVLRRQFNVYLTDVGQMSAILNTIPHMYGFNESFGIQTFLNINTLFTVIYALYEQALKHLAKKEALIAAGLSTCVLCCSMPYIIMSGWVLSNSYFMCFMFICVYAVRKIKDSDGSLAAIGMMYTVMSFLRMEGCIVALIILLCFSVSDLKKKELFLNFLLPMLIIYLLYYVRIFILMFIDAPYTFLTPKKAVIQIGAIVIVSVYILFIRGRLPDFAGSHVDVLIPLGLMIVNAVLLLYNKGIFIENAKAFAANISNQSGWGLFPMMIIGIYAMCFIASYKRGRAFVYTYWDLCFISYMLTATAVSFARGDALRESIGDSGNRVMLQVILLAFFAAAEHILQLQEGKNDGK